MSGHLSHASYKIQNIFYILHIYYIINVYCIYIHTNIHIYTSQHIHSPICVRCSRSAAAQLAKRHAAATRTDKCKYNYRVMFDIINLGFMGDDLM